MSVWLLGLGISAGYLINKNLSMHKKIDEMVMKYNDNAEPADPGPPTECIRAVQRRVPDSDRYEDINVTDLPVKDVQSLTEAREAHLSTASKYEQGPGPIEGVYLNYGDRGF